MIMLHLIFSATIVVATAVIALIGLKGFTAWLDLKRMQLQSLAVTTPPSASNRIELADVRERLRKLEAIAAGVDL